MKGLHVERAGSAFLLLDGKEPLGRFSSLRSAREAVSVRRLLAQELTAEPGRAGCYKTKREAASAFINYGPNRRIVDDFGGPDLRASGGEFDALNEYTEATGKRRVVTIRQAVEAAIPAGKAPYCLSDIRLDLLNETAPVVHGREGRSFRLPAAVAESQGAAEYEHEALEREYEAARNPRRQGRPSARKKSIVQKVFKGGRIPVAGPRGPGFPLSGYQYEDDRGRIVSQGSAKAVGPPVRVKYRPKVNGARPSLFLRPGDKPVAEEARARAEREDLRRRLDREGNDGPHVILLRKCLPYLYGEMVRRTGHEFDCDADAKLRDLIERIRAQIGEEK